MKKAIFFLVAVIMAGTILIGCSGNKKAQADGKTLVAILMPEKLEIWIAQEKQIKKTFEGAGYRTISEFAEGHVDRQVSQIENAVLNGAKYIIIAAQDGYSLSDAVEKAKKEGVVIIANDRLIMNTQAVDYYTTFDLVHMGELFGQYVVDKLGLEKGEKGPFNMEIFSGSPDDPNAMLFYQGKMSKVQKYIDSGVLVVPSGQIGFDVTAIMSWDTATAQARMDNLLSAYYTGKKVDVVLSSNDSVALGVINSLEALGYGSAGRPFPVITGQDCEITAIKAIQSGRQSMSVFIDPVSLANITVNLVNALEAGGTPKINATYNNNLKEVPTTLYDLLVIDNSNWRFLIDVGYYTEDALK